MRRSFRAMLAFFKMCIENVCNCSRTMTLGFRFFLLPYLRVAAVSATEAWAVGAFEGANAPQTLVLRRIR